MTKRRHLLALLALAPFAGAVAQKKPVRIGVFSPRPMAESGYAPHLIRRLEELGYRDGTTMALQFRAAESVEHYAGVAAELLKSDCDVIFSLGGQLGRALRELRPQVPVVFMAPEGDPVRLGLVSDLRRPDGNLTGVYVPQESLVGKRLEVLRDAMKPRRLLVLLDATGKTLLEATQRDATRHGIQLTIAQFSRLPYDYEGAIESGRKAKVDAALLLESPRFSTDRSVIATLLLKSRMPAMGFSAQHASAGVLFALSANQAKAARRCADLGVQVLKGAKPADIPVEQADEFELAINAATAKKLGIKLPESVLARATRIVQ